MPWLQHESACHAVRLPAENTENIPDIRGIYIIMKIDIFECLWPGPKSMKTNGKFDTPREVRLTGEKLPEWLINNFKEICDLQVTDNPGAYTIKLEISNDLTKNGEYELSLKANGTRILAADKVGLTYAARTLEQLFVYFTGKMPEIEIKDRPAFKKRCFMVDMGRSVWSLPLLKRMVRILHRLKMNQLHLHLYDDELCSIKFKDLPLGSENPYSLTLEELKELVEYAAEYYVEVIPELEAWGHVGSIVYHYPELRGGDAMYRGSAFIICEETFDLVKKMVSQIAACMPDKATIHLGLDEAEWYLGKDMPKDFTPADMVQRYYDIIKEVGSSLNKDLTLRIWADHTGRPVPEKIKNEIIIEPWCYWNSCQEKMLKDIEKYSKNKQPWMAGAGVSGKQYRGAYHATRFLAKNTEDIPNIHGINITFWDWNNIDERFISLFVGAYYLWNPSAKTSFADVEDYELYDHMVFPIMYAWQAAFRDADPDEIRKDRGPVVHLGHYHFGDRHNQPVADTAPLAKTLNIHDYFVDYMYDSANSSSELSRSIEKRDDAELRDIKAQEVVNRKKPIRLQPALVK
jgi:hypothetical protein